MSAGEVTRIPFSDRPSFHDEYVGSTHVRVKCEACGEWVYTIRHVTGGPAFFPRTCQVCGEDSA